LPVTDVVPRATRLTGMDSDKLRTDLIRLRTNLMPIVEADESLRVN